MPLSSADYLRCGQTQTKRIGWAGVHTEDRASSRAS